MLNRLEALGETQDKLAFEGETVTLQQLRGIEINERAAALAELVLRIGWLQWHLRTRGRWRALSSPRQLKSDVICSIKCQLKLLE